MRLTDKGRFVLSFLFWIVSMTIGLLVVFTDHSQSLNCNRIVRDFDGTRYCMVNIGK